MTRHIKYSILFVFLFNASCFKILAEDEKSKSYELKGYIKDLQSVSFQNDVNSLTTVNLIHNRINLKWDITTHLYTRFETRNRVFYGEQLKMTPDFGNYVSHDNGYVNLTRLWVNKKTLVATTTIDRVLLNYSSNQLTITAGRQRINWGINTVWNPNDLFNAYDFLDFDYEERPGTDGLRVQYYPTSFSTVETSFKPSKNKNETVAAILFKTNKWIYDFQFIGGLYCSDIVVGGGWAGHIKDAGFKGEITYFREKENFTAGRSDFTSSLMLDYSFKNSWYASASVLYVQNPTAVLLGAVNPSSDILSAKSLMPFKWSFYTGLTKAFSPIITGTFSVIYSTQDNSTIFFPTISYNVAQNFDLDLIVQSFFSDQYKRFESTGNAIHLRIKWSF